MSKNNSLIDSINPINIGYRLKYVEIYNWGGFDKKVHRIDLESESSLITGKNGCGKTTLIDAVLTLLVPNVVYNQASEENTGKRERDKKSYILGQHGEVETGTKYLRKDKASTFSVLLATFHNQGKNEFITLVQVRHFTGNNLQEKYVIVRKPITIVEDIKYNEAKGKWFEELKKNYPDKFYGENVVEKFTSLNSYLERIVELFNMKSIKALNLFKKVSGVKVLGDLNHFIKENLLDPINIEKKYNELNENFKTLNKAHNKLEQDKEQFDLLSKINEFYLELEKVIEKYKNNELIKNNLELYTAYKKVEVIKIEIDLLRDKLINKNNSLAEISNDEKINQEKLKIKYKLSSNSKSDSLKEKISSLEQELEHKKNTYAEFENSIEKLGITLELNKNNFSNIKREIKSKRNKLEKEKEKESPILKKLKEESSLLSIELKPISDELKNLKLRKVSSNIPSEQFNIRKQILQNLNLNERDLPFVGELIKVSDKNKIWKNSIEEVLRPFAISLIVTKDIYDKVTEYVNRTKLNGKITYYKAEDIENNNIFSKEKNNTEYIIDKLDFNFNYSHLIDWIKAQITSIYNYKCVKNEIELKENLKAITKEGLIKSGKKHSKNDRKRHFNHFVLGWNNTEKIEELEEKERIINSKLTKINSEIKNLNKEIHEKYLQKLELIIPLEKIELYKDINFILIENQISEIKEEVDIIEKNNPKQKKINKEIEDLELIRDMLQNKKSKLDKEIGSMEDKINELNIESSQSEILFQDLKEEEVDNIKLFIENKFSNLKTLKSKKVFEKDIEKVKSEVYNSNIDLSQKKSNLEKDIENLMRKLIEPSAEIENKFSNWFENLTHLSISLESIDNYLELFQKISEDDLPKHTIAFEKHLKQDMVDNIKQFSSELYSNLDEIKEQIKLINFSLKDIDFNITPNKTYIQIEFKDSHHEIITEFKTMLSNSLPDINRYYETKDKEILNSAFENIKKLLNLLGEQKYRLFSVDTRNWLDFIAKEYFRENNLEKTIYKTTGALSGGEKPQLAYTILCSGIAYQYNLGRNGNHTNSFRLVMVDEAFTKQDEDKSTFLLELCKKLNLQLLVVTPNVQANLTIPYISSCHYIEKLEDETALIHRWNKIELEENINIIENE